MSTDAGLKFDEQHPELSIVMPCLNEVRTVGTCIKKAQRCIGEMGIHAEIIIADNGSDDGSVELAEKLGARVVHQSRKGYGAALKAGIAAAKGHYIIMGDCDDSYDFLGLAPFVEKLREGYFLVMGNRFAGGIKKNAMPPLHRYFGNPLLTFLGRVFFRASKFGDFYCGLRGFRTESVRSLSLHSDGMEFALEMVIKFTMRGDWATEVPTTLSPDGRDRAPHLKSFRDGWRSLRFYLIMAPRWMFGIPGIIMFSVGSILSFLLLVYPPHLGRNYQDLLMLFISTTLMVVGYQSALMGVFAKLLAIETGLHPPKTILGYFRERSALVLFSVSGLLMILAGIVQAIIVTIYLINTSDLGTPPVNVAGWVFGSTLCLLLGAQNIFSGFLLGEFNLAAERRAELGFEHMKPV